MDQNGDAALTKPPGEPDVVEVRMGEHEGGDRRQRPADGRQQPLERAPGAGQTRVHHGQLGAVLDDVEVHVRVLDPMHAAKLLH